MNDFVAQQLPILVLILGIVLILCTMIAVFFVDLKLARTRSVLKKKSKSVNLTVVVLAENNELTVRQCLESIRRTQLRSLKIVIVDNCSADTTPQIIRTFIKDHPKLRIVTLFKKKPGTRDSNILQAIKKSKSSDYTLVMGGNITASKDSFNVVRSTLEADLKLDVLIFKSLPFIQQDFRSVSYILISLSNYLFQKSLSQVRFNKRVAANEVIVYKTSSLLKASDISSVVVKSYSTEFRSTLKNRVLLENITVAALFLRLLAVTLVSYFAYIAVHFRAVELLLYSFALFIIWFVFIIFSVPSLSFKERLNGIFMLPMAYPLLYAESIFTVVSSVMLTVKNTVQHKNYSSAKRL